VTWVPAESIAAAARVYAQVKPASIRVGNAVDDNLNSVQTARAISILRAITGNVAIPGGDGDWLPLPRVSADEFALRHHLSQSQQKKRLGGDLGLLWLPGSRKGALPQLVVRAILDEDPYPVRALCVHGSNPLLTWSNARETYKALHKLDFLYVADLVMTPTAELADVVLPVTTYLEANDVVLSSPYVKARQKVTDVGECWSDAKIINELAKKLNLGAHFWDDVDESLDMQLEPLGLTFEELKRIGTIKLRRVYREYERAGFKTPSGKVELYSSLLAQGGQDPLPVYREPPETPQSAPELSDTYPLVLTSWHSPVYDHSANRHVASLRGVEPDPIVEIHPETAASLGIDDGDWVYIETRRGRIRQRARLAPGLDPRVVGVSYAWWFPEEGVDSLHGWRDSNLNILTDSKPPYNPQLGSTNLRGMVCRVYADEREQTRQASPGEGE